MWGLREGAAALLGKTTTTKTLTTVIPKLSPYFGCWRTKHQLLEGKI